MLRDPMADESKEDRLDRELIELLNELRVALPGVQVLFAFLLTVPFTNRFERVNDLQKDAYLVALVATAIGSVLLIAPTAYHRIRFRDRDKEAMIQTANRLAIAGTVLLALGMTASVFFVTDFLFRATVTSLVTAVVAGCFVWFWYGLPLLREARD
jgi:Flp pilus assembly protein TadB